MELQNETPVEGAPKYVIGPNVANASPGDNRSLLSVYCARTCERTGYRRSLGRVPLREDREPGHPVFTTRVPLASGETERVELDWSVSDVWTVEHGLGVYRLTVQGQPTIRPTHLMIDVALPAGASVTAASDGFKVADGLIRWGAKPSPPLGLRWCSVFPKNDAESSWERIRRFLSRPVF